MGDEDIVEGEGTNGDAIDNGFDAGEFVPGQIGPAGEDLVKGLGGGSGKESNAVNRVGVDPEHGDVVNKVRGIDEGAVTTDYDHEIHTRQWGQVGAVHDFVFNCAFVQYSSHGCQGVDLPVVTGGPSLFCVCIRGAVATLDTALFVDDAGSHGRNFAFFSFSGR